MSIAASVVVAPSRLLRSLVALFGACNVAAAVAVLVPPDRFRMAPLSAAFFLLAAAVLLHSAARRNNTHRIDISGLGQLRLTVQQDLCGRGAGGQNPVPVLLLSGSTLWPSVMMLRLCSGDGALVVLPVLRDSLTGQQFRALAVALRATGAQDAAAPYHPIVGLQKIF